MLDAVADGLIEATGDLLVLVAVWVDPRRGRRDRGAGCEPGGGAEGDRRRVSRAVIRRPRRSSSTRATRFRTRSTAASDVQITRRRDAALPSIRSTRRSAPPGIRCRASAQEATVVARAHGRGRDRGCVGRRRAARPRAPRAAARRARPAPTEAIREICETVDFHGGRPWAVEMAVWDLVGKALGPAALEAARRALASGSLAYASSGELLEPASASSAASALRERGRPARSRSASTTPTGARTSPSSPRCATRSGRAGDHGRREPGLADAGRPRRRAGTSRRRRSARGSSRRSASTGSRSRCAPTTSTATRAARR